jgi:GTP diphosphokinase / guanosine-3',5'-bis(diphosphate) 3'-diphosphatase
LYCNRYRLPSMPSINDIASRYRNGDRTLIERAFEVAERAHKGQKRASGEPYITHPLAAALYLSDIGLDAPSVAAALLHDVIEDCGISRDNLEEQFGPQVAFLVDGVTKLKSIRLSRTSKDKKQADVQTESLKKMFFAMAEDLRVIIIKLADRLHNMKTLQAKDPAARERIALETMEIYAPIADRLGMGRLKGDLEDLAFPYAYPKEYSWLKKTAKGKYEDRLRYIERAAPVVRRYLTDAGVPVVDIHARAKRVWSLYRKLKRYEMNPDKVMDLVALRIIVPDIKSCYEVLGIIHTHYKPLPGRIKDYIALPKPNGYRSLHTTVFCEKGRIAEIQVRTQAMHDHAEQGIAAHWSYTEAGKRAVTAKQAELAWVNQLKRTLKDIKDSQGMANLKIDFFKDRIFALTPNGDVKDLPEGATPVDFAYAVHSELGHRTMGALVNARMVPLTYALQSGDVVEIHRGKEPKPSKNWLRFVRTTQAAKHIRAWFREREISTEQPEIKTQSPQVQSLPQKSKPKKASAASVGIPIIAGQTGLAYKLGRCCSPAPGSSVVGYLTLTKGLTVHRTSCQNIKAANKQRILDTKWS